MSRPVVGAAMAPEIFDLLFDEARLQRLGALAEARHPLLLDLSRPATASEADLRDIEVLITSWGAPRLDRALLERMPRLRAVLHAAGSVHGIVSEDLWDRDILVTSAADANAIPVAEYTFAAIVMASKRAFVHARQHTPEKGDWAGLIARPSYGISGRSIGVVGFSRIGRRVVRMLQQLDDLDVLVADPLVDPDEVAAAGATLVPLEEMLPRVDILSLHAPALPTTRHMIAGAQLAALHDGVTVINTARGSLIDHDALLAECRTGRLDAILDVTEPEPLAPDSEFHRLANVAVTPHIAGSLGSEVGRLADSVLGDLAEFVAGRTPAHRVARGEMDQSA